MPFDIQYANPNSTRTIFSASTQMAYSSTSAKNNLSEGKTKKSAKNNISSDSKHTSGHKNATNNKNNNNKFINITSSITSRSTSKFTGAKLNNDSKNHSNGIKSPDLSTTKPSNPIRTTTPDLTSSIKSPDFSSKDSPDLSPMKSSDLSNLRPSDYSKLKSPTVRQTSQSPRTTKTIPSNTEEVESDFKPSFNIYMAVDNLSADHAKKSAASKIVNIAGRRNQLDDLDPLCILPPMNPYREINKKRNQDINKSVSNRLPFQKSASSNISINTSVTDLGNIINDDSTFTRINRNNKFNARHNLRSTASSKYTNSIFESLSLLDVYLGEKTPQQSFFLPAQEVNQIYEISSTGTFKDHNTGVSTTSLNNVNSRQKHSLQLQQSTLDKHNKCWLKNEVDDNTNKNQVPYKPTIESGSNSHRLQMQDILKFIDDDISQLDENENIQGFKDGYLHISPNKEDPPLNLRNSFAWSSPDTNSLVNDAEVDSNIHEYSQESVEDRASIVTKSVISKVFSKKEIKQLSNIFNTMSNHNFSNDESFSEIREYSCISENDENEEDSPILAQENKLHVSKDSHSDGEDGEEENINKLNENISAAIQQLIIQTKQRELEDLKCKYQCIEEEKVKNVRLKENKISSMKPQFEKLEEEEVPLRIHYNNNEKEEEEEEEEEDGYVVDDVDGLIFLEENPNEYSLISSDESRKNSQESCHQLTKIYQTKKEKKNQTVQVRLEENNKKAELNVLAITNNDSVNSFNIVDLDKSNSNHHVNCTLTGSTAGKKNVYFTANPFLQNDSSKQGKIVNNICTNSLSLTKSSSFKKTSFCSSRSNPSTKSSSETNSLFLSNNENRDQMIVNTNGAASGNDVNYESNNELLPKSSVSHTSKKRLNKNSHEKDNTSLSVDSSKLRVERLGFGISTESQNLMNGFSNRTPFLTVDVDDGSSHKENENMVNTKKSISNTSENQQGDKESSNEEADSSLLDSFSQELAIVADELFSPLDATSPSFMNVFSPTGSVGSYHDFFSNDEDFLTEKEKEQKTNEERIENIELHKDDSRGLSNNVDSVFTIRPSMMLEASNIGDVVSKNKNRLSLLDPESSACKEYLAKVAAKQMNQQIKQEENLKTYSTSPLNISKTLEINRNEEFQERENVENSTDGSYKIEEILDFRLMDGDKDPLNLKNEEFADSHQEAYYDTATLLKEGFEKKDYEDILVDNENLEISDYEMMKNMPELRRDSNDLEFDDPLEYEDITLHNSYCEDEDEDYDDDEDDEEYDYDITVSFDTSRLYVNTASDNVKTIPTSSCNDRKVVNDRKMIDNMVTKQNNTIRPADIAAEEKTEEKHEQNQDDENTIVYCKEVYEQMYNAVTPPASAGNAVSCTQIIKDNLRNHHANSKSVDTTFITEITPVDQINSEEYTQSCNESIQKNKNENYDSSLSKTEVQKVSKMVDNNIHNADTAADTHNNHHDDNQYRSVDIDVSMKSNVPSQNSRIMRKIRKIRRKLLISSSDIILLRESWASIIAANHNSNNVNHDAHRSIYSSLENPLLSSHIQENYFSAYSFTKQFYNNLFREVAFIRNQIFPSGSLKKQIIAFGNILMEGIKCLNNLFKIKKFLFLNNYINHENNITSKFCSKTIYGYSKFNIEKSNRYFSIFAKIFFRTLNENFPGDFNKQLKFCWTKFYKFLFSCIVGGLSEKEIFRIQNPGSSDPESLIFEHRIDSEEKTKSDDIVQKQKEKEEDLINTDYNIIQLTPSDASEVKNDTDIPEVVPCTIISHSAPTPQLQEHSNIQTLPLEDENVSSSSSSSSVNNMQNLEQKMLLSPTKPKKQVRFTIETDIMEPPVSSKGLSSEDINLLTKLKMVKDSLLLRSKLFIKRKPSNQGIEHDSSPPIIVTSHGVSFTLASPTTSC